MLNFLKRKLLTKSARLIISLLTIVICLSLVVFEGYAWFTINDNAKANGINMKVKYDNVSIEYSTYDIENDQYSEFVPFNDSLVVDFCELKKPGDYEIIKFKINNLSDDAVYLKEFGFLAPVADEESPRVIDDKKYYLGTQIDVSLANYSDFASNNITEDAKRLASYDSEEDSLITNPVVLFKNNENVVEKSESIIFEVKIEFFNDEDNNQNYYKLFGQSTDKSSNEKCSRRIYLSL